MDKRKHIVIGGTILLFAIVIGIILLSNNGNNWTTEIQKAQSYEMTMKNCNGREKKLDNSTLSNLSNMWSKLSNNGPWTGNTSLCYTTLTINYENNNIINQNKIIIIDNNTLVLEQNTSTIYYTNAYEVINYLNTLFKQ